MKKNKNSFELSSIIIKTLKKKTSFIVILISFLFGLRAFTKREIKYELSSEFIFNKFGIEEHLICKYSDFDCFKDFSRLSILELASKELIEKKDSIYFYALSLKGKSINVLTEKNDSVELFKQSLINIENSLIEKEKNNLNTFYQTLEEESKLNYERPKRDLFIYEYKANSIQNHISKGGKILIFKEPKVKEISKGYEMIFICIFMGLITSVFITLIREKYLKKIKN